MSENVDCPKEVRRLRRANPVVKKVIWAGWICVALSALFLYLSGPVSKSNASDDAVLWAVYLMMARFLGLCSFAIGGIAIFNHRWWTGVSLLLLSVVLPFLAYQLHGTI